MREKEKGSTAERETRRESRDVLNGQRVEERIHAKPTRSHDTFLLLPASSEIAFDKRKEKVSLSIFHVSSFACQRRGTANWIIKRQTMLRFKHRTVIKRIFAGDFTFCALGISNQPRTELLARVVAVIDDVGLKILLIVESQ